MNIIEHIDRPCEYVEVAQTALIGLILQKQNKLKQTVLPKSSSWR